MDMLEVLEDTITMKESIRIVVRENGKTISQEFSGDDLCVKTKTWMTKRRVIDKKNDRYSEIVTDPETGKIIHQTDHKLSEHRGHGSAKKKPKA
jgi:hypothetical protein